MEDQKFPCKEPGCSKEIFFSYNPVVALKAMNEQEYEQMEATLTCANGHTHNYTVMVPKHRR